MIAACSPNRAAPAYDVGLYVPTGRDPIRKADFRCEVLEAYFHAGANVYGSGFNALQAGGYAHWKIFQLNRGKRIRYVLDEFRTSAEVDCGPRVDEATARGLHPVLVK